MKLNKYEAVYKDISWATAIKDIVGPGSNAKMEAKYGAKDHNKHRGNNKFTHPVLNNGDLTV